MRDGSASSNTRDTVLLYAGAGGAGSLPWTVVRHLRARPAAGETVVLWDLDEAVEDTLAGVVRRWDGFSILRHTGSLDGLPSAAPGAEAGPLLVMFAASRAREALALLEAGGDDAVQLVPADVDLRREAVAHDLAALYDLTDRLRRECPWDRKQTQEDIVAYTLEETYELVDAIREPTAARRDDAAVRGELGDLLFQVYFWPAWPRSRAVRSGRRGGRHPTPSWCAGIRTSSGRPRPTRPRTCSAPGTPSSGTPRGERASSTTSRSPSRRCCFAQKLQQRAAAVGFDWEQAADVMAKVQEETAEIAEAMARSGRRSGWPAEVGDLLFSVVNLARKLKVDPELALRGSALRFRERVEGGRLAERRAGRSTGCAFEEMEQYCQTSQESYYRPGSETSDEAGSKDDRHPRIVYGRQILDSRGNPTVEVEVELASGRDGPGGGALGGLDGLSSRRSSCATAARPTAARASSRPWSTSTRRSPTRWSGWTPLDQREIDQLLIELDGTPNKGRLGANAILGTSLAVAKAAAEALGLPLYRYLGGVNAHVLPVPMMNILNGGKHADNNVDLQEFMSMPVGAAQLRRGLRMGVEVFHSLKKVLTGRGLSTAVGDEGGFAPNLASNEEAIKVILEAIEKAGYTPGEDIAIALDPAATEFFDAAKGVYVLAGEGRTLAPQEMAAYYADLCKRYPIVSIEDGMAEEDWDGWAALTELVGDTVQLVGDDLFVTNVERLRHGHRARGGQQHPHQAQPDRHPHRDPRRHRDGPPRRLHGRGQPPLGRDRGQHHRRPGGGHQRRPDQDRRPVAAASGPPSTTSCCASRTSWARWPTSQAWVPSPT